MRFFLRKETGVAVSNFPAGNCAHSLIVLFVATVQNPKMRSGVREGSFRGRLADGKGSPLSPLQKKGKSGSSFQLLPVPAPPPPPQPPAPKRVLVFGNFTCVPSVIVTWILSAAVLYATFQSRGSAWFNTNYMPSLGYFITLGIAAAHYIKPPQYPNKFGFLLYPFYLGLGICTYLFHDWIFESWLGIMKSRLTGGHFVYIITSFMFFALDDTHYLGYLLSWVKWDGLKAVFIYFFTWGECVGCAI